MFDKYMNIYKECIFIEKVEKLFSLNRVSVEASLWACFAAAEKAIKREEKMV